MTMTELIQKPFVQLLVQGGFMGVLIIVLIGGYYINENSQKRQSELMQTFITQQKEDTVAKIELAKALQSLTHAVRDR